MNYVKVKSIICLQDEYQTLFTACNRPTSGSDKCMEPVLSKIEKNGCPLHHLPILSELKDPKVEAAVKEMYQNKAEIPEISNEASILC